MQFFFSKELSLLIDEKRGKEMLWQKENSLKLIFSSYFDGQHKFEQNTSSHI